MEFQPCGAAQTGQAAVPDDRRTVCEGVGDSPVESLSFERGPAAAAGYIVLGDCPGPAAYDDQIGPPSFADVAAAVDAEEVGRGVGHHPYHLLYREAAALGELEHHHEGVLYGGQSGGGMEVILHFLGIQMGGVVGGHSLDLALADSCGDGLPVGRSLDGRVALDQ